MQLIRSEGDRAAPLHLLKSFIIELIELIEEGDLPLPVPHQDAREVGLKHEVPSDLLLLGRALVLEPVAQNQVQTFGEDLPLLNPRPELPQTSTQQGDDLADEGERDGELLCLAKRALQVGLGLPRVAGMAEQEHGERAALCGTV